MTRGWTRRQVLALGAVTATAGCVGQPTPSQTSQVTTPGSSTPEGGATPTNPDTTPPPPRPPVHRRPRPPRRPQPQTTRPPVWQPDPNDVSPEAKATAAQHIQATVGPPPAEVIDAQYGGILANQASVLVVTHQWGGPASAGTTYDVRLDRAGTSWTVTQVLPSNPGTPTPPSAAARQVLADPNIALPPAARADIAAGHVHDSVLNAMLALARTFRIGVSVVRSGHPTYVFGTARLSDHPFGQSLRHLAHQRPPRRRRNHPTHPDHPVPAGRRQHRVLQHRRPLHPARHALLHRRHPPRPRPRRIPDLTPPPRTSTAGPALRPKNRLQQPWRAGAE